MATQQQQYQMPDQPWRDGLRQTPSASQILLDLLSPERRDLGNDLVDILRQYNDNMAQYTATVNTLVSLIANRTRSAHPQHHEWPIGGLGAQATQGLFGTGSLADLLARPDLLARHDLFGNIRQQTQTQRPAVFTEEQVAAINRDTETFIFRHNSDSEPDSDNENEHEGASQRFAVVQVCPITHEPFQDGDQLMRIRRCRHTFKRSALMEWFGRSMSCPVCRGSMN